MKNHAHQFMVSRPFLELLGKHGFRELHRGDSIEKNMTVFFSDIRDFTALSEAMTPQENFRFINAYLEEMEPLIFKHGGFIDKYMGDGMMAIFPKAADGALDAAIDILRRLKEFNSEAGRTRRNPVRIGIGLNTGLMMVGTVGGRRLIVPTVIGDAVNLASRLESMTKVYGVPLLISEYVYNELRHPSERCIRFLDRVRVRGKERPQSVYEVFDADRGAVRAGKRHSSRIFEEALAYYHFRHIAKAERLLKQCLDSCPGDRPAQVYLERCRRYRRTGLHEGTGEAEFHIAWGPEFEIGHKLIDAQHRELFARVNSFVDGMHTCRPGPQADRLIGFLTEYVNEHFRTEEQCMLESGYPLLDLQREQHARFSRSFSDLTREIQTKLVTDRVFLLYKIELLVVDWIVNHTLKTDRHFGKYLRTTPAATRARGLHPRSIGRRSAIRHFVPA